MMDSCASLASDSEKITHVYRIMQEQIVLPSFILSKENCKSEEQCINLRKEGNELLKENNLPKALLLYSKSIAKSVFPPSYQFNGMEDCLLENELEDAKKTGSYDLALAFANRAFVLYRMGYYELCLKDVQRAEECNYPSHLAYKLHGRKARCLLKLVAKTDALKSCEVGVASLSEATTLGDVEKEKLKLEFSGLVAEIKKLKGCAQNAMRKEAHTYFENIQVSYGQNKQMPSASDAISVMDYEGMGRGIVATRDIKVGDILVVEEPFANLLEDNKGNYYLYCSHCSRYCLALIPCYRCSVAMFCSEQCRDESWGKYHYVDCYVSSIAQPELQLTKTEKLVLKVVVTASSKHESLPDFCTWVRSACEHAAEKMFDENGQYISDDYRTIYHLCTNMEKYSNYNVFCIAERASLFVKFLDSKTKYFSNLKPVEKREIKMFVGELIFRHLMSFPCNVYGTSDHIECWQFSGKEFPSHEIGSAVYAVASLFNHSCDPNVIWVNYGCKIILIALQAIKTRDQIFISYKCRFYETTLEQRKYFAGESWNFQCRCKACEGNWPLLEHLPKLPVIKCQHCDAGLLLQGSRIICCETCKRETNCGIIEDRLRYQDRMMHLCKQKCPEEKIPLMAKILQEWCNVVDNPWQSYYGYLHNFFHYWSVWSSMRDGDMDMDLL